MSYHVLENICTKYEKNLSDISTTLALPEALLEMIDKHHR